MNPTGLSIRLQAEYLHDHLLLGGGPAHVLGLADALVHGHLWPADRADKVSIPTVEYLERRLHVFPADWALRYQGGRSWLGRLTRRREQGLQLGMQGFLPLFHFSTEFVTGVVLHGTLVNNTLNFSF